MSKIHDALRKAAGEGGGESRGPDAPVPPRKRPEAMERPEARGPLEFGERSESEEPAPRPVSSFPSRIERPAASGERRGGTPIPPLSGVFAREMSHLRASVEQALAHTPQRTILIAAAVPGEGASTVAARFAQSLAEDPRLRVALVDTDLRNADPRPIECTELGMGFASVLAGSQSLAEALRPTGMGGLDVLPSEGVHGDPYALCTAENLEPFLDYLRGQYHYAVLDAAPVLAAPETAILGAAVDGVVMVVRSGRTKREVVTRGMDRFRKYGARVLGVVMNRHHYAIPEFLYRRL